MVDTIGCYGRGARGLGTGRCRSYSRPPCGVPGVSLTRNTAGNGGLNRSRLYHPCNVHETVGESRYGFRCADGGVVVERVTEHPSVMPHSV